MEFDLLFPLEIVNKLPRSRRERIHPERRRDRPCEASATAAKAEGANSGS